MSTDPRYIAHAIIKECRARRPGSEVLAFGSPLGVTVGIGARSYLTVRHGEWECSLPGRPTSRGGLDAGFDEQLDALLTRHTEDLVIGYLGFDLNQRHVGDVVATGPYPSSHVVVPEVVVEIDAEGQVRSSDPELSFTGPAPADGSTATRVTLSDTARDDFALLCRRVLRWIDGDPGRRATVCVRSGIGFPVDLPATFAAGLYDEFGLARSFYAWVDGLEFAGTSPELLVDGSLAKGIATHKLSGTFPSSSTATERLTDRLVLEHEGSAERMSQTLEAVGVSSRGDRRAMRLGEMSHLLTSFETTPHEGVTESEFLLGVLPTGTSPRDEGLALVARTETGPRGPYYGLFGVRTPQGELSWSQTLRAAFRTRDAQWVTVGAAVTERSTPELEVAEIGMKAAAITVVPARGADAG